MTRRSHRRQIVLFVSAVILPCFVLVALGLRMVGQERELAEARLLQERNRLARQLGEDLLFDLDQAWTRAAARLESSPVPASPDTVIEVVFAAELRDGRLVPPWEVGDLHADPGALPLLATGERQEVGAGNLRAAEATYRRALESARTRAQAGLARLFLARVLAKQERASETLMQYRALLALPSTETDEQGIPFSYYAADRLLELELGTEEVLAFLQRESRSRAWRTPPAAHLLRDVAAGLGEALPAGPARDSCTAAEAQVAARVRDVEQISALAAELTTLGLALPRGTDAAPDRWVLYGPEPWLLGLGRTEKGSSLLTAVRAEYAIHGAAEHAEGEFLALDLVPETAREGMLLDPRLQGVRVRMTLAGATGLESAIGRQRTFYGIALALVVGFTLFGAWLLWRDMQREVRMARLRSQFVSGVSHELRTPLTSIRMFAETLLDRGPEDRETHDEFLHTIVDESNRLSRLLGNVLEFSAIERGKRQYRKQPHDLAGIVRAALRAIQQRLDEARFIVNVRIEDDVPPLSVDGDAIEEAVLNLLTNAMKYSGGSRRIGLGLSREDGCAVIRVTDYGIGVRPSEQRRIFESFYRAESADVAEVPGTGLGLTLAEHIAEAHGGRVELNSAPGKGSTFALRLPLEPAEP